MPIVNHILLKRPLSSFSHSVKLRHSPLGPARRWAESYTKSECTWSGWHANVTFYFDAAGDAVMFKLMFG